MESMKGNDWFGQGRAAVSLTFDDARVSQIDHGLSIFEEFDVQVTFFVSPGAVPERLDGWHRAISQGHEIGSHTMNHPCSGNFPFAKDSALEDYTLDAMKRELHEADDFIERHLAVKPVSFAYPCGQTFVGRGTDARSYVPLVAERYLAGRGYRDESVNDPAFCDLSRLNASGMDGVDGNHLIRLVNEAIDTRGWLLLAGHEIGVPDNRLNTDVEALRRVLSFLNEHREKVWTAPIGAVAEKLQLSSGR